jgi:hypothetical protein
MRFIKSLEVNLGGKFFLKKSRNFYLIIGEKSFFVMLNFLAAMPNFMLKI